MRIVDLQLSHVSIRDWTVEPSQVWCVLGDNGAGKSQLAAALTGDIELPDGAITGRPQRVHCASFETQQLAYEADLAGDDSNFLGGGDHGATGLQMLVDSGCDEPLARELCARFGIAELLDRSYRKMSSGEARRVMLLRELATRPQLLILDEPFEGLDPGARGMLIDFCTTLVEDGQSLLLMVNRREDIAEFTTHLAVLRRGQLALRGPRDTLDASPELAQLLRFDAGQLRDLPPPPPGEARHFDPVVRMRACAVRYGEVTQFEGFDWTLRPGAHTLVTGDNGCGKSTLLQLISGDHPQCYSNDIRVFGYQRGTGESIWDVKRHVGLVSPALHRDHRVSVSVCDAVVSGLYDSIGLYETPHPDERALALQWLDVLGLRAAAAAQLRKLSYGQQRLVLIARALIKQPPLTILDEPTQGLDDNNRHLVLAFLEQLAGLTRTTLLFVSHRHDEHLDLFGGRLHFEPSATPGVRYAIHGAPA